MSPNADFSPESAVEVMFKRIITFFDYKFERTDSPSKPAAKGAKRDGGRSTTSERLKHGKVPPSPPLSVPNL